MALVSHHSGSLDTSGVVASLQQRGHTVTVRGDTIIGTPCTLHLLPLQVELLQHTDVRPNLARVRQSEARTVIVDISAHLIKPFLYQVNKSLF